MTCSEQVLSLTTDGPVAVIRFSQPSNVNVITLRWAEEMQVALENVSRDANVRAVMLCGAGRGFLAGGDLAYLHRTPPEIAAREAGTLILQLNRVIESIVALPIPTLASVHGATAGAGISLLLACDYAIAAADARFVFAYSQIAATPDGGLSWTLPRVMGLRKAMEFAFLTRAMTADEALAAGIVNRCVPASDLALASQAMASELAAFPRDAFALTKRMLRESLQRPFSVQLDVERINFQACVRTSDLQNAVEAFFNRNKCVTSEN